MGVYIAATEIADLLPRSQPSYPLVTATSNPVNFTKLDAIVLDIEAELNGAAAAGGYAVPINSSASYAFQQMHLFARYGAAAEALEAIFPGSASNDKSFLGSEYRAAYQKALADLASGALTLPGAGISTGEDARLLPVWSGQPSPNITMDWQP